MTKSAKNRAGLILLGIMFLVALSVWFFFSDLKIKLFDLPALNAKRQSVVKIISVFTENDVLIEDSHRAIVATAPRIASYFCLWGYDSWIYKSNRTWSDIAHAFDLSFVSWTRLPSPISDIIYENGPFQVIIERKSSASDVDNMYNVQLSINDPPMPSCGL
jgi:hypothetical protein